MSIALSILFAFAVVNVGKTLNVPPEYLIIATAIILAGGLAGED
jgi:hypothetical protein